MRLPVLTNWTAGDAPDQDLLNEIDYAIQFLLNPPEAVFESTVVQALPAGFFTPITFQNIRVNNDGMWNAATPTIMTIKTPGWWHFDLQDVCESKADDKRRITGIDIAGGVLRGDIHTLNSPGASFGVAKHIQSEFDAFCNVGDQLRLLFFQQATTSINTLAGTTRGDRCILSARWVGL